jgi:uncharacterized OB-fold protein
MEAGRCTRCSRTWFPPRTICAACHGTSFETVRLAEEGAVETFTVIHVAPSGFEDQAPYAVAIVKLDDGVRITCQVVDIDPASIEIGLRVRTEFRKIQQDGHAGMIMYGYKAVPA